MRKLRSAYRDKEGVLHDYCLWCGKTACLHHHLDEIFAVYDGRYADVSDYLFAKAILMLCGAVGWEAEFIERYEFPHYGPLQRFCDCGKRLTAMYSTGRRCARCLKRAKEPVKVVKDAAWLLSLKPNQLGWYERVAKQAYLLHIKSMTAEEAFTKALAEAEAAEDKRKRYSVQDAWARHGSLERRGDDKRPL